MSAGPILPSSVYYADTAGRLFPNFYAGGGGNAAAHEEGHGVKASLDADATIELRFALPPTIPGGTLKLRSLALANATSGAAKLTVSDAAVATGASPSAATLSAESQTTHTWAAGGADKYNEQKVTLTAAPSGNDTLVVAVKMQTTGWTLAQVATFIFSIIWE
jgi:hypothetical protein